VEKVGQVGSANRFAGRLIGDGLDTLLHLVGTTYGDIPRFGREFAHDGTILYPEDAKMAPVALIRTLGGGGSKGCLG